MQTSLGTQLFMLKWDFIPRSLSGKSKSFHHEMSCTRSRLWNWKESNSEMAYWIFLFFLLQPAKWTTRRARWPIVHLTVVKATCVTRFKGQQQNLKINQSMKPLNWLQALEPFCLFLLWTCLLNPVSTNVFHLSLDVFVYLCKKYQFSF